MDQGGDVAVQSDGYRRNRLHLLHEALRGNRAYNFVYLNNPKVACSSIKTALWGTIRNVPPERITSEHVIEESPFTNDPGLLDWAGAAFVFTVVRNPYARVLSAYLDKVVNRAANRENLQWLPFARRHGLDPNATISFDHFVELLVSDTPEQCDSHWCPQWFQLLNGEVTPNFTGQIERMDRDFPAILSRVFPGRTVAPLRRSVHRTGAAEGIAAYYADAGTVARVGSYYARDFATYGYDPDLSKGLTSQINPVFHDHPHPHPHPHPAIAAWAKEFAPPAVAGGAASKPAPKPAAAPKLAPASVPDIDDYTLLRRLKWNAGNPERLKALSAEYAEHIRTGPDFLREAARPLLHKG